jgi:hypothetical protein
MAHQVCPGRVSGQETEIIAMVKATTVMWLGHLVKSDNMNLCSKLTFTKAESTKREGASPSLRW